MKPLEFRTSSSRFGNERQFQPWYEDNRVHRVGLLLRFVAIRCVSVFPSALQKRVFLQNGEVALFCDGSLLESRINFSVIIY
jgi:hypothetical protein